MGRPTTFARVPNPVLSPSGLETEVLAPDVKFMGGQWVMLYSPSNATVPNDPSAVVSSSLAYSPDLLHWTKEPNNPILSPIAGEHNWATDGSMVYFNGTYYLYYMYVDGGGNYLQAAATSPDLVGGGTWTRQGQTLLGQSNIGSPFCRVVGSAVEMWFIGTNRDTYLCTSTDGLTFSAPVIALAHDPAASTNNVDCPDVFNSPDGNYHLFTTGGAVAGRRDIAENVATTPTGTWARRRGVLGAGPSGAFDDVQVFDCCPVVVGPTVYLFYAGSRLAGQTIGLQGQIGLALASLRP